MARSTKVQKLVWFCKIRDQPRVFRPGASITSVHIAALALGSSLVESPIKSEVKCGNLIGVGRSWGLKGIMSSTTCNVSGYGQHTQHPHFPCTGDVLDQEVLVDLMYPQIL